VFAALIPLPRSARLTFDGFLRQRRRRLAFFVHEAAMTAALPRTGGLRICRISRDEFDIRFRRLVRFAVTVARDKLCFRCFSRCHCNLGSLTDSRLLKMCDTRTALPPLPYLSVKVHSSRTHRSWSNERNMPGYDSVFF